MMKDKLVVACEECGSTLVEQVTAGVFRCCEADCEEYFELDTFEPHDNYRRRRNKWMEEDE